MSNTTKTDNQIKLNLDPNMDTNDKPVTVMEEEQKVRTELPADSVIEINGVPVTTSLKIAEVFGKDHNNVIKAIKKGQESYNSVGAVNFNRTSGDPFVEATYKDSQGKERPMYYLTEEGFSFVVMSFTGEKAATWKWKYIAAFERMRKHIQEQQKTVLSPLEILEQQVKIMRELKNQTDQNTSDIKSLQSAVSNLQHPFNRSNTQLFRHDRQIQDLDSRVTACENVFEDKGPVSEIHALIKTASKVLNINDFQLLWQDFYRYLSENKHIELNLRLTRLKNRRREQGWSNTKINKLTRLDAITASPDLWKDIREAIAEMSNNISKSRDNS